MEYIANAAAIEAFHPCTIHLSQGDGDNGEDMALLLLPLPLPPLLILVASTPCHSCFAFERERQEGVKETIKKLGSLLMT